MKQEGQKAHDYQIVIPEYEHVTKQLFQIEAGILTRRKGTTERCF
jgi:hypothetical protein